MRRGLSVSLQECVETRNRTDEGDGSDGRGPSPEEVDSQGVQGFGVRGPSRPSDVTRS